MSGGTKKPSANRRARSRWFGERLSFAEVSRLSSKSEQTDELMRRLGDITKAELSKSYPSLHLLARIREEQHRLRVAAARPPNPPKKGA